MEKYYKKNTLLLMIITVNFFCFKIMCPPLDPLMIERPAEVDTQKPRGTLRQRLSGFFRSLVPSRNKPQSLPVQSAPKGQEGVAVLPLDEGQGEVSVSVDVNQGITKAETKAIAQGSVRSFLNRLGLFKPKVSKEQKELNAFKEEALKKLLPVEMEIFQEVSGDKDASKDQIQKLLEAENEIMQECGTFYLYYSFDRKFEVPYFESLKAKFIKNLEALKILDLLIKNRELREKAIVVGGSKVSNSFAKAKLSMPQRSLVRRVLQLCEIDTSDGLNKNGGQGIVALVGGLEGFKVLMLDVVTVVRNAAPVYEKFKDKANPTQEELKELAAFFKEQYGVSEGGTFLSRFPQNRFAEIGKEVITYFRSMSKEEKDLWGK